MSEIKRVSNSKEGPPDGVSLEAQCAVALFSTEENPKDTKIIRNDRLPCKILSSFEDNILSISVPDMKILVSIRMDEAFTVMKATADGATRFPKPKKFKK